MCKRACAQWFLYDEVSRVHEWWGDGRTVACQQEHIHVAHHLLVRQSRAFRLDPSVDLGLSLSLRATPAFLRSRGVAQRTEEVPPATLGLAQVPVAGLALGDKPRKVGVAFRVASLDVTETLERQR